MEDNQQLENMMKGEPSDQISLGGDKLPKAQVIKLDGGPEGLASFLSELLGAQQARPSGAELLSSIPPALPGDGPEDAEWKAKHMTRMQQFAEELAKLDFSRVDAIVVAYRLHDPAQKEGEQEGFYLGGGHLGRAQAIEGLLVCAHDRLEAEIARDYDMEEHARRVAAGEQPCGGCGHFHD